MSKGLFSKLAVTNIKNNKQFYVPYLLTGILTVGMFYIMCALAGNKGIEHMSGARDLQMILNLGIGVIGIFSVIFLFYTNSFIIKRRKKELRKLMVFFTDVEFIDLYSVNWNIHYNKNNKTY